jgi:hypothetical protein
MNTGSLGNEVAQIRKALNKGGDAMNVKGVDKLAQRLNDELPGFVKITDTSNPSDVIESFLSAKDKIRADLDGVYAAARQNVTASPRQSVADTLYKKFNISPNEIGSSSPLNNKLETVINKIQDTQGKPTALFETVSELTNNKSFLDSLGADRDNIVKAAREYARDAIIDAVPGAEEYFTKNANIWDVTGNAANYMNSRNNISIPLLGKAVIPGFGSVKEGTTNLIANSVGAAGKGAKGLDALLQRLPNVDPRLAANTPKLAGIGGALAFPQESMESNDGSMDTEAFLTMLQASQAPESMGMGQEEMGMGTGMEEETIGSRLSDEEIEVYKQLVTPVKQGGQGMTPSNAEKYMTNVFGSNFETAKSSSSTGAKEQTLNQKQAQYKSAGDQAQEALNLLESGEAKTGKLNFIGSAIGNVTGMKDPKQTEYEAIIGYARTSLMNGLLGAAMSEREMANLAPFIPQLTDEPQVAKQKLKTFKNIMDRYIEN